MKNFFLFCFFISITISAQNQRFMYEYKFIPDSTNLSKVETEIMNLDISKKGSKFYSRAQQIADSIFSAKSAQNSRPTDFSGIKLGKVKDVVEKMYPDFTTYLFQTLGTDTYKIEDDRKINWKISPDKEKIGEWEVQKATTKMYGRTWTAWFANSFPFQDGPYKFSGLPGLIVKIADQNQTHIFELKAVKNLSDAEEWKSNSEKTGYLKPILIKQDIFKKIYQRYRADPVAGIRQMMNQSGVKVEMTDKNGKVLDIKKALIDQEKSMKEGFKKDNNLLELDLIK